MERLVSIAGTWVDLGNIKAFKFYKASNGHSAFIHIEFLRGKEYIMNPNMGDLELILPEIDIKIGSDEAAKSAIILLKESWQKYLESKGDS